MPARHASIFHRESYAHSYSSDRAVWAGSVGVQICLHVISQVSLQDSRGYRSSDLAQDADALERMA
jgi:hypothetical protein